MTTLSIPCIRSSVWKRPGLLCSAASTRSTKAGSCRGSAHMGPPSWGGDDTRGRGCQCLAGAQRGWGTGGRAPTWCRCWQNSQVGPTGGPVAAPYLKLEEESQGVSSAPLSQGNPPPPPPPQSPPSPAVPSAVARDFAQALEVVSAAAHAVIDQGLLAAGTRWGQGQQEGADLPRRGSPCFPLLTWPRPSPSPAP